MCAVQDSFKHWTAARRRIDYPIRECPVWRKATAAQGRKQPSALASGELPESWLGTIGTTLVVVARHEGAALAHEKVEIRALVRLQHVIEIQAPVAARRRRFGLLPLPAPLRELVVRYE